MNAKSFVSAVAVATLLAAPLASFAQSNQPVTRAQVRAELVQLEKAGYNPAADRVDYPADIQAAQQRVAAQAQLAQADTSGYGAQTVGSSAAGSAATKTAPNLGVYFGH
ncbi:DUF4148 domain-containing protein [Paraburkholderia kururiensis]|uniref:DUF4148 domain-containing protein n=1 Tax=Paraburkholderia kururiensis TaxID=984307 RepID=UPI0005A5DB65|nr:DUF4148 domain-containing protein [Paraburkholderia kururiensis]